MPKTLNSKKVVARLLKGGVKNYKCTICGSDSFECQEQVAGILLSKSVDAFMIKEYLPTALIACKECGHIDFFRVTDKDIIVKRTQDDGK